MKFVRVFWLSGVYVEKGKKNYFIRGSSARIVKILEEGYPERPISMKVRKSWTAVHTTESNFTKFGTYGEKKTTERAKKKSARDDSIKN